MTKQAYEKVGVVRRFSYYKPHNSILVQKLILSSWECVILPVLKGMVYKDPRVSSSKPLRLKPLFDTI